MENSIPKDIIKNNGDLGGEQLGGASASRAAKFNRTLQGAKQPSWEHSQLGVEKVVCMCWVIPIYEDQCRMWDRLKSISQHLQTHQHRAEALLAKETWPNTDQ